MIPKMRHIPTPPPRPNKNKLWERYAKGENLKPTYNLIFKESLVIPPPPIPIEPKRIIHGGKLELTDKIVFTVAITFMLVIGIYFSFFAPILK